MLLFYNRYFTKRLAVFLRCCLISLCTIFIFHFFYSQALTVYATEAESAGSDMLAEAEARKSLPIQTNQIENWPQGPAIGAQGAILMDANTGTILYGKNIHEKLYPASTTKIMTCLLAMEHSSLDEVVTFSHEAVFSIERGSSNIGIDEGEAMTMEEALYGILIGSANEVANGVGEHIAGSAAAFSDMMNERAKQLGCDNTHFMNANGLYDDNHYTTAYDLALIARAFFNNDILCKVSNTPTYTFFPTATQPDEFTLTTKNRLIQGRSMEYEYLVGSKTGYTTEARQTLVSCAEKDGMKLICVILKEESPSQFQDTIDLFNYGFSNFSYANVADNETRYAVDSTDNFSANTDIFGDSEAILSLSSDDVIVLPNTISFSDTTSELEYDENSIENVALINYSYHDAFLGSATVNITSNTSNELSLQPALDNENEGENGEEDSNVFFINVRTILTVVIITAIVIILLLFVIGLYRNYRYRKRRRRALRQQRVRRRRSYEYDSIHYMRPSASSKRRRKRRRGRKHRARDFDGFR